MRTVQLHTEQLPSGRAVLFAKELSDVAVLPKNGSFLLTYALFDGRHPTGLPATVIIKDGVDLEPLKRLASEFGITLSEQA